jgi:hypothetical protein
MTHVGYFAGIDAAHDGTVPEHNGDEQPLPGMPGTRPEAVEPDTNQRTGWTALVHFAGLFLLHPLTIVFVVVLIAWLVWRLL